MNLEHIVSSFQKKKNLKVVRAPLVCGHALKLETFPDTMEYTSPLSQNLQSQSLSDERWETGKVSWNVKVVGWSYS